MQGISNYLRFLLLTATLCLVSTTLSSGQGGHSIVHLDKSFYVNGEVVWYKLFLPAPFQGRSRAIQVTVLDDRGVMQEQHYHKTAGATTVDGYYKVPFDCQTGMYQLVFSGVRKEIGGNVLLAQVEIPIYNDFEMVNAQMLSQSSEPSSSALSPGGLTVTIHPGHPVAGGTQEVKVEVSNASGASVPASLSIAVVDEQLVSRGLLVRGPEMPYGLVEEQLQDQIYVKGIVRDANGDPLQVNVLGAFSTTDNRVQFAKSSNSGTFSMALDDFTGPRQLQFVGFPQEVEALWVELSHEIPVQPSGRQVQYTPEVLAYLTASRKRKKIYQYFTMLEQNIVQEQPVVEVQQLKPNFTYKIEEYEDFDFMKDFFGELITPLKFRLGKDSMYTASLENPRGRTTQETHLSGPPLFIVDGKLTRNADFIARMDMGPIKTIELFYNPSQLREAFSAIGRSGVVRISTRLPDAPFPEDDLSNIFTMNGLLPQAEFAMPENSSSGVPQLRAQLYWNADLSTDSKGEVSFSFPQSHDISTFRISIVAQGSDGSRGYGEAHYQVGAR